MRPASVAFHSLQSYSTSDYLPLNLQLPSMCLPSSCSPSSLSWYSSSVPCFPTTSSCCVLPAASIPRGISSAPPSAFHTAPPSFLSFTSKITLPFSSSSHLFVKNAIVSTHLRCRRSLERGLQRGKVGGKYAAVSEVYECIRSERRRSERGEIFRNIWKEGTFFGRLENGLRHPYQAGSRLRIVVPLSILHWNRRPQLAGQIPRVVVITSGKGGVGKTTTTANIGLCLARLEFKVVAIDADVGLRNLDLLLGLENRVNYTAVEVFNGDCRLDQALIRDKRWTNFELLCINKPRYKMPLGFGGKALTWLVDALRKRPDGSPDFVLIDCPAGIDAGFITAITPANEAILVTTPDITSLRDADRVTGLLECDGIKDIKMIVNRVRSDMIKGEDMMSVLDVQEMLGLPLLGVIPEDAEVIRSTNRGYPLVLNKPPTLAGLALEQAAWRLVEQDSMTAVLVEETPTKKGFFPFLG